MRTGVLSPFEWVLSLCVVALAVAGAGLAAVGYIADNTAQVVVGVLVAVVAAVAAYPVPRVLRRSIDRYAAARRGQL